MPELHLSKSEIFWHGALYERLIHLTKGYAKSKDGVDDLCRDFPPYRDVVGVTNDTYAMVEFLALECGIARYVELVPDTNEESPASLDYRGPLPDDIAWSLADGTAVSQEGLCDLKNVLGAIIGNAFAQCKAAGLDRESLDSREEFVEGMNGTPIILCLNPLQRSLYQVLDAHGPYAARGFSRSNPVNLFFLNWRGEVQRFTVSQQNSPQYTSFLWRFNEYLALTPYIRLSMVEQHQRNGGTLDELIPRGWVPSDSLPPTTVRNSGSASVGSYLDALSQQYAETPEWNLGIACADATNASRVLASLAVVNRDLLADRHTLPYVTLEKDTMGRIEALGSDLLDWMQLCTQEATGHAQEASPEGILADTRTRLSINSRFLLGIVIEDLCNAATLVCDAKIPQGETAISSAASVAWELKVGFRIWLAGGIDGASLVSHCGQLSAMTSDAMKLAYGMLYFKELEFSDVYIDPTTQAKVLRQPRAVREQLAEAISQYERQTLANCSVTSVCGLVDPVVQMMAAAWMPAGNYRGVTADILKWLLGDLLQQQRVLRDRPAATGDKAREAELLLKLYCVNLAFGLNGLGNLVRHHSDKELKRHDGGVMLHGLCVLLQRING